MNCRFCDTELRHEFINLINTPPSNSFLRTEQLDQPELFYPLKLWVCEECYLVQIDEYKKHHEIFDNDYAYFSSYSISWLNHCKKYADNISSRLDLKTDSFVIEVASNDGYLLQFFKEKNIECLGIEPTENTASAAKEKGVDTLIEFFNRETAKKVNANYKQADLIICNNVIAHDPNLNEFVSALKQILKPSGTITIEIPHIYQLISNNQFDTIYHEHFSYFSLLTHQKIYSKHGLTIYDVDEIPTHGGSLRLYIKHCENNALPISNNIETVLKKEQSIGLNSIEGYLNFQVSAQKVKYNLVSFLIEQKNKGVKIASYGAAAKGNTLLNFCGIKNDILDFVVDRSEFKQGLFTPGTHIPIVSEQVLKEEKPDYILILPWNIKEEIIKQLEYIKEWNGKFIIPVPDLLVI